MGKKEWYLPDMYRPADDNGSYVSHEAVCVLNTSDSDCTVDITLYFEDREPVRCEDSICPARRTVHIRTDRLKTEDGKELPKGIGYAGMVTCSVPVVVQYTRVDTTQPELALMTTMAY